MPSKKSEQIEQLKRELPPDALQELEGQGAGDEEDAPYNGLFQGSPYRVKDGRFYRYKGKEEADQYLGNFFIAAQAEIIKDNGAEREMLFELRAVCEGREMASALVAGKDFESMNFIVPNWGLSPRPAIGQNVMACYRDSVKVQSPRIRREYIYTHTGWREINGRWAFLHAGGAIGAEDVRVELDGRLSRYVLQPCKDIHQAQETALKLFKLAPREVMFPLIGFVFLTPLNEFLRQAGIEPAFILYLLGTTGAMKSTLAALVLSFFGGFDNKSLPASFKDTANSLEKQGFILKDVLSVVDDYHPSSSRQEAVKMQARAQALSRMYGDRHGRGRMNADTTLRISYIPKGNIIITGEDMADIGQSGAARNVVIELKKGDINKNLLSELQEHSGLLSECMAAYIEWLIPQAGQLPAQLKAQFKELRSAAQADDRHARIAEAIAHLQTGLLMFLSFLTATGRITEKQEEKTAETAWGLLLELAENQNKRLEQDKPSALFLSALGELLSTGRVYVEPIDSTCLHGDGFIGYCDDTYYYLYGETTYKAVVQFYAAQGRNFPLSKHGILKQLGMEGVLLMEGEACTKIKKIGGKTQRFIWVKTDAVEIEHAQG